MVLAVIHDGSHSLWVLWATSRRCDTAQSTIIIIRTIITTFIILIIVLIEPTASFADVDVTYALLSLNVVRFIDAMSVHDPLRRVLLRAFTEGMHPREAAELFRVPERTLHDIRRSEHQLEAVPLSLHEAVVTQRQRTRQRLCAAVRAALETWLRSVLPVHSGDPYDRPRKYESNTALQQHYERELDTIIGDTIVLLNQRQFSTDDCGPPPDERLRRNIQSWLHNHDSRRPATATTNRSYEPRSAALIRRVLHRVLHVREMHESWGEFDCGRCMENRRAEARRDNHCSWIGDDLVLSQGALHDHIRRAQQQSYFAARQAADVNTEAGVVITQDFTGFELGANIGATKAERKAAKVRTLIMSIETGDKQHHYRAFMCSNAEAESSDFFFLRAAWNQLLRQDGSPADAFTPPIDAVVRSARCIQVWSDGASGQFKQRYALMMYYILTRLLGGRTRFQINFLAPGHGHSLADACAARFKQAANRLALRRVLCCWYALLRRRTNTPTIRHVCDSAHAQHHSVVAWMG